MGQGDKGKLGDQLWWPRHKRMQYKLRRWPSEADSWGRINTGVREGDVPFLLCHITCLGQRPTPIKLISPYLALCPSALHGICNKSPCSLDSQYGPVYMSSILPPPTSVYMEGHPSNDPQGHPGRERPVDQETAPLKREFIVLTDPKRRDHVGKHQVGWRWGKHEQEPLLWFLQEGKALQSKQASFE